MVVGCTCSNWTLNILFSITYLRCWGTKHKRQQFGKDRNYRDSFLLHQSKSQRWDKQECNSLTYLRSFFSGGDFLSHPWKMISPPLMFVRVCCFLLLYNCGLSLVHDGSWRLACSKCCRRLAPTGAVCSPHLIKTKVVLVGDVASRSWLYCAQHPARKIPIGRKKRATWLLRNYARPADEEPRGNSTDAGWGSIIGCLQFVFPTHTTPTEQREGWAALGYTEWDNRFPQVV